MADVTVRDLRNRGADVLARVERGESMVVTRDGHPVARVVPLTRPSRATAELIAGRRHLPPVDPAALRANLDEILDAGL
ncbi:MAG: type II toxin-antitoxin system prevent-host-death family antitoxin [Kineosporiaceae bacterium]|jgi:prevent-host-death family protein